MKWMRFLMLVVGVTFVGSGLALAIGFLAQMDDVVRAPGEIRPRHYAELRPVTEGRVLEVLKREGSAVQAGEVVLRMDSEKERIAREKIRREIEKLSQYLEARELKQTELRTKVKLARAVAREAQSELKVQEARLAQARMTLKQAQARPEAIEIRIAEEKLAQQILLEHDAEKEVEDTKLLLAKGMISEQSYQKKRSAYQRAQSETRVRRNALQLLKQTRLGVQLARAKNQLAAQQAALGAARARLDERQREVQLSELKLKERGETVRLQTEWKQAKLEEQRLTRRIEEKTLRAPLDGILHDFHVKPGQSVTHKQRVAWVYDISGFLFYAYAKQVDLPDLAKGQPGLLYIDALPYRTEGTFDAEVREVAKVAKAPDPAGSPFTGSTRGLQNDPTPRGLVILKINPGDPRNERLRVGFPGYAEITVGRASLFEVLFDIKLRK